MAASFQRDIEIDDAGADAAVVSFEAAWAAIASDQLSTRDVTDVRMRLARAILDHVRGGERDPERLQMAALEAVTQVFHAGSVRRTGYYL
jgi:hypothetical protein